MPGGVVTTFAGSGVGSFLDATGVIARFNSPSGIVYDSRTDNLYIADSGNNRIRKITPTGTVTTIAGNGIPTLKDGAGTSTSFNNPTGLFLDEVNDKLYIADTNNHAVRVISGVSTTVTTTNTVLNPSAQIGSMDGLGNQIRLFISQ